MSAARAPTRPVFGIAECGVLTALARAERFGVIAILQRSIARHMRYLRQMGLMDRLAGERPLELSVAEIARARRRLPRMIEVGRALKEQDGANAIVMGCAGMARHRKPLEDALGIPVIDPDAGRGERWRIGGAVQLCALSLRLMRSASLLLRRPFLVALPHVRERLAERGVEIAEQARERAILRHVDCASSRCPTGPRAHGHARPRRSRGGAAGSTSSVV